MLRVDNVEGLFDAAVTLAGEPLPEGDGVGVVTNAGGPGVLASDAVEFPEVRELGVDPLLAGPDGVTALDFRLSFDAPGAQVGLPLGTPTFRPTGSSCSSGA